jgi:ligand-binding sensor domain-containing protein
VVYFNKLLNLQNFSNNCNSITETSEGKILFVIQNLGLGELSQAFTTNQKFELLTSADGLPADKIFSVYKDSKQHIWLYTVNGLCNFNVDSKKAITFTEKDGLIKNFV